MGTNTANYAGDPGNLDPTTAFSVKEPASGNPRSSSSIREIVEPLVDYAEYFRQAFRVAQAFTVNGIWSFTQRLEMYGGAFFQSLLQLEGATGDTNPAVLTNSVPTVRKLLWKIRVAASPNVYVRLYSVGTGYGFEIVLGAAWNDPTAGGLWNPDNIAAVYPLKMQWRATSAANLVFTRYDGAGTTFDDASWSETLQLNPNGTITKALVTLSGALTAAGNITATAGKIVANGDPASDQGRVYARQFVSTAGSAPTVVAANKAGADNGGGDGAGVVTGTDTAGLITVTTGAATGNGEICRITFNKAFPTAPVVTLTPTNSITSDLGWEPNVLATTTYFAISSGSGAKKLTGGAISYGWSYHVIG